MSRITLDEIKERVRRGLDGSSLAPSIRNVAVETIESEDDFEMVRVLISIRNPRRVNVHATNELVDQLRSDLLEDDGPFLIFQFPEAA